MANKKKALGKGLGALLEDSRGADSGSNSHYDIEKDLLPIGTVANVPLDKIESNPYQPREDFAEENLTELANSIKEQGVIQPVTVRKIEDDKYQLITGERRLKASKMAGLEDIPAYVRTADDHAMLEMAIVENIQRENLNPVEIAIGYQRLMEEHNFTQEVLSERLGKSRSSIANYIRLLKLPADIQIGLRQEKITMGHARSLIAIENTQNQLDIYNDIIAQNLSVREVEEIVQNLEKEKNKEAPVKKQTKNTLPKYYDEMQKKLTETLGNKVQVKTKTGEKGKIILNFSSPDEFEKIIGMINNTLE